MTVSRLPVWHGARRLDDLRTDGPFAHCGEPIRLARLWVSRMRGGDRPSKGLGFFGPVGTGKSTVAAAIAVELGCTYWDCRSLFARAREEFGNHVREPVLEHVIRRPVLVLDDIGKMRGTDWVRESTQDIIERRFDRGVLTVFTTNLEPEAIRSFVGDAAFSRLRASSVFVPVFGEDLRGAAA